MSKSIRVLVVEDSEDDAVKAGAHDYIMKDKLARLVPAVERELCEAERRRNHKQAEVAIQTLVKSTVGTTGQDFFDNVVKSVCEWLGTDYAFIGQIVDGNKVKALSAQIDGEIKRDCTYYLKNTICENVIKDGYHVYTDVVNGLFPEYLHLAEKIVKGYVGTPLRDKRDKPIGIFWTASRNKLNLPLRTAEVMDIIAAKASSEIERKQMEERIRQHNEELEKLVEERTKRIQELEHQRIESEKLVTTGRMVARVAHEINNPLAAIKGAFVLIKDAITKDHKHYKYISMAEKECGRINRILQQLFDLYRPYHGKYIEFDVNVTIREIVSMLKSMCDEYGVSINLDIYDESVLVTMSEDYLRQILFNIIRNAIEASPRGSLIRIKVKTAKGLLTIMVSDQGRGIADELRSQIFEPFFTTKGKDSTGGLGLGLSTTKGIVEVMGGSIDFMSEKDKGTTFTIDLPTRVVGKKTEMIWA